MVLARSFSVAVVFVTLLGQASAESFDFEVVNKTDWAIRSVSVRDGEVTGFQPPCKETTCSMTVTLPDGVCVSRLRVNFRNLTKIEDSFFDFCRWDNTVVKW